MNTDILMSSSRYARLFHTVRYLKPSQIGWRFYYRLLRRRMSRQALSPLGPVERRQWVGAWSAPTWMPPALVRDGESGERKPGEWEFEFLGERGGLASLDDWNHPGKSKLWLYNLHYLDDLGAQGAQARHVEHCDLVARWIDENPPLAGNGWEPYPLSLRLVNLVKWLSGEPWQGGEPVPEAWFASLARQAQALSAQREYHILANHLFANGKALTFVGAFLQGQDAERWLRKGLAILDAEVPEQFLDDGGHFERSPMYHATLLWDLADLIHLAECSGLTELHQRAAGWRQVLARGLAWLEMMSHPDGEIGFFNDAAFGIAPSLDDVKRYAEQLGVVPEGHAATSVTSDPIAAVVARYAKTSGYVALEWPEEGKALLDLAPVGPDYQAGHAHADTLSMELSLFGQRVLVNSGTSRYGDDTERHWQRSTAAHNTVTVDDEDSSEVWSGFRVARRALPVIELLEADHRQVELVAHHTGYQRLKGRNRHRREWVAAERSLTVTDTVTGPHERAMARWYLHPTVHSEWEGESLVARLPTGQVITLHIQGADVQRLEASEWHPGFGNIQPNRCLVAIFSHGKLTTHITW
ncbi:heparinase II/III family protein [Halomonas mongoliensis]|uniref:heparinase II/III family protein n=1 Tax=Halomonas mongoliensis TaxID=321265 RepID=UPI00403AF225